MKTVPCIVFSFLTVVLCLAIESRAPVTRAAQAVENPPLGTANNELRDAYPDVVPAIRPGYANTADVWLLYAQEFDSLSGAMQSHLMRKYGLDELTSAQMRRSAEAPPDSGDAESAAAVLNGFIASDNSHVNDPDRDLRQRLQSETSSAVSGQNAVVAYNDSSTGVGSGISYSGNGGLSWRQAEPPIYPGGGGQGDPALAAGPGGVFYYAHLASTGLGFSTIGVTRSADGGATWSPLVNATASSNNRLVSQDKEWLMADNSASRFRGNLYLSWTRFTGIAGESSGIAFARSTDGGRTWSPYRSIGKPQDAAGFVQGSTIAVGPDGEVYVSYFDTRLPGIAVVKSTDGGLTFGAPVTALRDPGGRFGRNLAGGFELFPGASIDTDRGAGPNRGKVYLTTTIEPVNPRDEADVVVTTSSDGGATWGAPVKISDESTDTDQFMSSLAVMPGGLLGVMWYDRRNDPANNVLVDVYLTTSFDGGRTFSPNRRMTASNWPFVPTPLGYRTAYHGDYNQMSAGDAGFLVCWADDRSGTDPDVYANMVNPFDSQKIKADFITSTETPSKNLFAGSSAEFAIDIESLSSAYTITPRDTTGFLRRAMMNAVPSYPGLEYRFSLGTNRGIFTVTAAPGAAPGTYPISVTVSVAGLIRSTSIRVNVSDPSLMAQVPQPLTALRDTVFQPKAAVDARGDLHIVSGGEARRLFSSFGSLNYARFRNGVQIGSAPVAKLLDPNSTILNHSIGVDGAGAITVVWRQFTADNNRTNIHFARSTNDGASFTVPVNLTRNNGQFSFFTPALAVDRGGAIDIVIAQFSGVTGLQEVVHTRSTDGGANFTPRTAISGAARVAISTAAPAIALDAAGAPAVVFVGFNTATSADVFLVRAAAAGGAFMAPVNVSNTFSPGTSVLNVASPAIAIDPAGNPNVAFVRVNFDFGEQEIYFARSANRGVSFLPAVNASRTAIGGAIPSVPSVAVDRDGTIGVAWSAIALGQFPAGRDLFFARSMNAGQSFATAVNLSNNIGLQAFFPVALVNERGQLSVLWEDDTGGNNQATIVTP